MRLPLMTPHVLTSSGTYYDTLVNINGCDSILTLNLTINPVVVSVSQAGANLTANAVGATYQWLSCIPYHKIIGETNQTYIVTSNGYYAVEVTENGCVDTSICYPVGSIGVNDYDFSNNIKIFPNPVHQKLQIKAEHALQNANVKVLNITGQVVAEYKNISAADFTIDMSALVSGHYFIQINDGQNKYVQKVFKE